MEAISGLRAGTSDRIAYHEAVHHPALAQPETASGFLSMTRSGRLVRDQHRPRREISEIGQSFHSVRKGPEEPENLLPIPSAARPMFDAIRHAVSGDAEAITREFSIELLAAAPSWRVRLVPREPGEREIDIILVGCGAVLTGMEIAQPKGVRRVLTFEVPQ